MTVTVACGRPPSGPQPNRWPMDNQPAGRDRPMSEENVDKNSGSEAKLLSGGNPQIPKASKHDEVR